MLAVRKVDLNDQQRAVLRWISEGCPDGIMDGYVHRVSASALRARELVRISGRGPTWRAELTELGRAYLEQLQAGDRPAESPSRGEPRSRTTPGSSAVEPVARTEASRSNARSALKTERLVADVLAAGGTLVLPDETARGGIDYRQRAYAAQRHGRVPAGKHLSVRRTAAGFEISLLDGATGNELGADPVLVPARVSRYHRVARDFRDRTYLHEISRKALPRAARIVHALAGELERRGHEIACRQLRDHAYTRSEWKPSKDGQFTATLGSHSFALRLSEKGVGLRGPWEAHKRQREEDRRAMRFYAWDIGRIEPYDKGATGQLDLSILAYGPRQQSWGDRQRWSLEDRLPQVVRELETLAEEAEERRLERERQERERQRQWEEAMAHAKDEALKAYRIEVLRQRVSRWEEAERIRAYCAAVEARHGTDVIDGDPDASRWLEMARAHAERLQGLPRMPEEPDLTPDDLKPYLGGWSPYGPERGRWHR